MADLRAVQYIKHGSFEDAVRFIPEHHEHIRQMLDFWRLRKDTVERSDDLIKKKELLLREWRIFYRLYLQLGLDIEYYRALKEWVFTLLLEAAKTPVSGEDEHQASYYLGIAHLMLSEHHDAITCLNRAVQNNPGNMRYLAGLASCWEQFGHDFQARLMFREAFFQDPDAVDIACLGSRIIDAIIERILNFQYPIDSIRYWIPVFGRIFCFFNVKRALTTLEYGSLVKRIRTLENHLSGSTDQDDPSVLPKLLNGYLWMIDYHEATGRNLDKIKEVESQFKDADPAIYALYIEHVRRSS